SVDALDTSRAFGSHEVAILDYGPSEPLEPDPISLTSYMFRSDDLTGIFVDNYLGYDISEVPMRGRVWYPADEVDCPVLFIAHGNHSIMTDSYLGYDYLGEYLASHGYVVVSVDQNACNMLSGENDARAVLLLEHIELLLSYNGEEANPLYSVLDPDNISIAGHSRGGEMVATAYLFNEYDHYPENAVVRFDYHFNIRSLIAIAPTVNQYKPADHSVEVENVNYLLLHGASDRDVTDFMGMSQYENVTFSGEGDYIKSALYIAGANHGQFNSLWGEYDCKGVEVTLLNTESLLSEREQQTITSLFVKVFLDVTLLGDDSCRSLLTDWEDYSAQLPETVYVQCHEESGFLPIADFEEDSEVATATLDGARLYVKGVNWWTEELMDFAGRTAYDTHALRLRWKESASLSIHLPVTDMTDTVLSFDICDLDAGALEEGDYDLLDAVVTLKDTGGNTVTARLIDHAIIYPVLSVKTDKLDFLFDTPTAKEAFATVSIPVDAFVLDGEGIDLSRIREIKMTFSGGGEIALDNIGITPA
ncbi:MAG: chlorophyllase, partial [Firmicutes bacterium]|nr:chlorophyllase [Bacillota bacterium]